MKTREWLFTIAIIILIQFIIQMGALIYSNESNVLNYVSFAGTIVSIILAIIAIVYSFVQTISQQNSSSNISNQVDKLITVVDQVDVSKKFIGDSLEHLKNVSQKLDATIQHQSKISAQVETLANKIGDTDFEKHLKLISQEHINKPIENNQNHYNYPLINGYNGTRFVAICLYIGEKRNFTLDQTYEKIIVPFTQQLSKNEDSSAHDPSFVKFQEGIFIGAWQLLAAFDLIDISSDKKRTFTLKDDFRKECKHIIEYAFEDEDEDEDEDKKFLKDIISMLSELDNNNKKHLIK